MKAPKDMAVVSFPEEVYHVRVEIISNRSGDSTLACNFLMGYTQVAMAGQTPAEFEEYMNEIVKDYEKRFDDEDAVILVHVDRLVLFSGDDTYPGGVVATTTNKGFSLKSAVQTGLALAHDWAKAQEPPF